jgi:hypothetical protein
MISVLSAPHVSAITSPIRFWFPGFIKKVQGIETMTRNLLPGEVIPDRLAS